MMTALLNLHWREPLWLWLAAVPLLFGWWRYRRHVRLLGYADAALLPWAANLSATRRPSAWRALIHTCAWLLLALAAAGPRQPLELRDAQTMPRHRMTLMVVLDVSASMRATDIAPGSTEPCAPQTAGLAAAAAWRARWPHRLCR